MEKENIFFAEEKKKTEKEKERINLEKDTIFFQNGKQRRRKRRKIYGERKITSPNCPDCGGNALEVFFFQSL